MNQSHRYAAVMPTAGPRVKLGGSSHSPPGLSWGKPGPSWLRETPTRTPSAAGTGSAGREGGSGTMGGAAMASPGASARATAGARTPYRIDGHDSASDVPSQRHARSSKQRGDARPEARAETARVLAVHMARSMAGVASGREANPMFGKRCTCSVALEGYDQLPPFGILACRAPAPSRNRASPRPARSARSHLRLQHPGACAARVPRARPLRRRWRITRD